MSSRWQCLLSWVCFVERCRDKWFDELCHDWHKKCMSSGKNSKVLSLIKGFRGICFSGCDFIHELVNYDKYLSVVFKDICLMGTSVVVKKKIVMKMT